MVTRRRFLAGNAAAVAASALGLQIPALGAVANNGQRVLVSEGRLPRSHRRFWNDWPNYMTQRMNEARTRRRALLAEIRTKQQITDRTATVRSQLWDLIGGQPQKTPLNPRITGAIDRKAYRIEKLIYESMPKWYVTANLYIPQSGKAPYPTILAPIGHTANGKAAMRYQYAFQTLARNGYVVLTWDPLGQGERTQYYEPGTNHVPLGPVSMQHTMAGRPMILFGDTLALYLAWDGIRGLDYLLTRPEVDSQRIGCMGQSGGGTMTMFMGALEPRIHVAVPIEGIFENLAGPFYDPPGAIADAECDIVGSLPLRMDRGDLLAAFVPKPMLVCYTKHDEGETYGPVNTEATIEVYDELKRIYGIYGDKEKIGFYRGNLPHGMDFFSRRAMYGWFNRWFGKMDAGVDEAPYDAAPDSALHATRTGEVSTSLHGRSVVHLNTDRARSLLPTSPFRKHSANPSSARDEVRDRLTSLLALPSKKTALHARTLSTDVGYKKKIEEIEFESEPGVRILGWFIQPQDGAAKHPCVLYISDGYADETVVEPSPYDEILNHGYSLCAVSVRGTGVSIPRPPRGGPVFYQQALFYRYAWANLVLGYSAMGQRVWDILRTFDYLTNRPDVDASRIRLIGQEDAGLAALMAAALDERAQSILLARTLVDYMSIVESPDYSLPLAWFAPGILRCFDLPDLTASLYPRPVWLLNAVDSMGKPLPEPEVRQRYSERLPLDSAAFKKLTISSTPTRDGKAYTDWLQS